MFVDLTANEIHLAKSKMFTSKSLEVKYVYRHAGLACLGTTLTTAVARLKPTIFVGDRVS